jgi:hypothetical protein
MDPNTEKMKDAIITNVGNINAEAAPVEKKMETAGEIKKPYDGNRKFGGGGNNKFNKFKKPSGSPQKRF